MLTCTESNPNSRSRSASFSRTMKAVVFTLTQKSRERAYSRMRKKSLRMNTSPPLKHEEESAGLGQLVEHVHDLGRAHLAVIVVVQVAVDAALVAAVRHIELDAQRHARLERPFVHFLPSECPCALLGRRCGAAMG